MSLPRQPGGVERRGENRCYSRRSVRHRRAGLQQGELPAAAAAAAGWPAAACLVAAVWAVEPSRALHPRVLRTPGTRLAWGAMPQAEAPADKTTRQAQRGVDSPRRALANAHEQLGAWGARRGAFSDVRVRTHASGRAWEARATGQCGLRLLLIWPKDCRLLFLSEVERREAVQLIIRGTLAVARCDGPDVRTCAPATAGRAGGRKEMKRERSVDRALIQRPSGLWAHNHLESEGRLNKSKNLSSSLRALQ